MTIHDWQLAYERACNQEKAQYDGQMMARLYADVDNAIELSRRARLQREDDAKLCVCGEVKGHHANPFGQTPLACPNPAYVAHGGPMYLGTTFVENKTSQVCIACIPTNSIGTEGCACGKPAVNGTELCEKHLED